MYKDVERSKEAEERARIESLQQSVKDRQSQMHNQTLHNIDPFERKRRIAERAAQEGEFTSRKVTSRKDEANERSKEGKNYMSGVSPTEYMNMSKQSYYQEFERPKGSFYTQTLHDRTNGGDPAFEG